MRFYADWFETFQMTVAEPDSFADVGESVVVTNVARQRGRDGIEVSARNTLLYTVRGGKIWRIRLYLDPEPALKAVGLAE